MIIRHTHKNLFFGETIYDFNWVRFILVQCYGGRFEGNKNNCMIYLNIFLLKNSITSLQFWDCLGGFFVYIMGDLGLEWGTLHTVCFTYDSQIH